MKEVQVLPVRCRGCGVFFDLWHELREQENLTAIREQGEIQKVVNQLFCWHCRQAVSVELELVQSELPEEELEQTIEISIAH